VTTETCKHASVECINPYELIRKYRCHDCKGVMLCDCDKSFAERFRQHQVKEAVDLKTQQRIGVTLGFQPTICNTCRGLPEEPHPKAQMHGATSKILRYYWREIEMETVRRLSDCEGGFVPDSARKAVKPWREKIRREIIEELKILHANNPKYTYREESQENIIAIYGVPVTKLTGRYTQSPDGKGRIWNGVDLCTPEDYVIRHYEKEQYDAIKLESAPFHVLFGSLMWLLIQDTNDPLIRTVGFGNRNGSDEGGASQTIWTPLPSDFGTSGYFERRQVAIAEHFEALRDDLEWLFDYWLKHSENLRQYLWAHRAQDIAIARTLLSVVPADVICRVLWYLIGDYWKRYLGWPDLLVFKADEYFLAEVKSSSDKLSEDQKTWIAGNAEHLHMPFTIVKIHRSRP
jgi:hypothetical protein